MSSPRSFSIASIFFPSAIRSASSLHSAFDLMSSIQFVYFPKVRHLHNGLSQGDPSVAGSKTGLFNPQDLLPPIFEEVFMVRALYADPGYEIIRYTVLRRIVYYFIPSLAHCVVPKFPGITSSDMYALRCAVLHQGVLSHPRMQYRKIDSLLSGTDPR